MSDACFSPNARDNQGQVSRESPGLQNQKCLKGPESSWKDQNQKYPLLLGLRSQESPPLDPCNRKLGVQWLVG